MASDELIQKLLAAMVTANETKHSMAVNIPLPEPLVLREGNSRLNFKRFEQAWSDYLMVANKRIIPEEEKVALLRTVIGKEGLELYESLGLLTKRKDGRLLTSDEILAELKKEAVCEDHLSLNRYKFHTCVQGSKDFDEYLMETRRLLKEADYTYVSANQLQEDLLKDQLIVGISNEKLRLKFFEKRNITLKDVVETCKAQEAATKRIEEVPRQEINKIERQFRPGASKDKAQCKFCGKWHEFVKGRCPAFGKKCLECDGLNHFKACCPKRKQNIKKIDEESEQIGAVEVVDACSYELLQIQCEGKGAYAWLDLRIGESMRKVKCQLDTGAAMNVIGYRQFEKLFQGDVSVLQHSEANLHAFGNHRIDIKGYIVVNCLRNTKWHKLRFQISKVDHEPLLSLTTCIGLELISFCKEIRDDVISSKHRISAKNVIEKYSHVFQGIGLMQGEVHLELDDEFSPVKQAPRRMPLAKWNIIKKELEELSKQGVITKEEHPTDWCSNVLLVEREGKYRLVLDPRELNKALKRPHYQMPTLEQILPVLGESKVFSKLDARKGFWQMKLSQKSSKYTTFWTPFGRYRWLRCPFGLAPLPEIFQQRQHEIIWGLHGVESIADDLLVFGKGKNMDEAVQNHNENLENLLKRLSEKGCKLNSDKLDLLKDKVTFYGHLITCNGLQPDPEKVTAIREMSVPQTKEEVHRFIGMVNYLAKFIDGLSTETEHLRKHIRDGIPFAWNEESGKEFEKLKNTICQKTLLKYLDLNKPVIIETDASNIGLGACLLQDEGPIYFASRVLTAAEMKYAPIEKELLGILYGCRRFDQFISGNKNITVKTDHKPLLSIFQKPIASASKRIQVMMLLLQKYPIKLFYVPGKEHFIPDALSRAPVRGTEEVESYAIYRIEEAMEHVQDVKLISDLRVSDERIEELKAATMGDECCQLLMQYVHKGWPDRMIKVGDIAKPFFKMRQEISTQDKLVFKGRRIIVPMKLRKKMIERLHLSHSGIENTTNFAKDSVYWPGISQQIKDMVSNCEICLRNSPSQRKMEMQTNEIPTYPFQFVRMDIFEKVFNGKKQQFLCTVDEYSDFFEVDLLKDIRSCTVITITKKNFARHGIPEKVSTDGGMQFCSQEFIEFAKDWEFQLATSSPHHQQGNGKAEAAVKVAKSLITKSTDFYRSLANHRNTANKVGSSPSQRIFSRRTRCAIPMTQDSYKPEIQLNVPQKIEEQRKKSKFHYDKKTKIYPELKVGQPVVVKAHPNSEKTWTPGIVTEQLKDRAFIVNVGDGAYVRNQEMIKPYQPSDESDGTSDVLKTPLRVQATAAPPLIRVEVRRNPKRNAGLPKRLLDYDREASPQK